MTGHYSPRRERSRHDTSQLEARRTLPESKAACEDVDVVAVQGAFPSATGSGDALTANTPILLCENSRCALVFTE